MIGMVHRCRERLVADRLDHRRPSGNGSRPRHCGSDHLSSLQPSVPSGSGTLILHCGKQVGCVCACTGLYFGFAITVLVYPLVRTLRTIAAPQRKWLFLAAGPMAIASAFGFLGIWQNTHLSRFATGALLGATSVFYVMPGFVALGLHDWLFADRTQRNEGLSQPNVLTDAAKAPSDYSAPY